MSLLFVDGITSFAATSSQPHTMTTNSSVSRLESLPGELFNCILSYVFDPACSTIPESASRFRGYRFDTALLRVNKIIHQLAKSYLHASLSWVRFDINWESFLIDPHWLGVSYIIINRPNSPKRLPFSNDSVQRRSTTQDVPTGRLHVRIAFPLARTPTQGKIKEQCFNTPTTSSMSLLVLEADFKKFIRVLRMNDLAYCYRSGGNVPVEMLCHLAMSFNIHVTFGQEHAKSKHLVCQFGVFSGPTHKFIVSAAPMAKVLPSLIGPFDSEAARVQTFWEAIAHLFHLKRQGDEHLRAKSYSSAYMCYDAALTLEHNWLAHDPRSAKEKFWKFDQDISKAFGICLAFNLAMAQVAGGLRMGKKRFRGQRMRHNMGVFFRTSGAMATSTVLDIVVIAVLFEVFTEELDVDVMREVLGVVISNWESVHGKNCSHRDSTPMGKIYDSARAILVHTNNHKTDPVGITACIETLRLVAQEAHFQPMRWAIHETMMPKHLAARTRTSLPRVRLRARGGGKGTYDPMIFIPTFNQLTQDIGQGGEKVTRVLV